MREAAIRLPLKKKRNDQFFTTFSSYKRNTLEFPLLIQSASA